MCLFTSLQYIKSSLKWLFLGKIDVPLDVKECIMTFQIGKNLSICLTFSIGLIPLIRTSLERLPENVNVASIIKMWLSLFLIF